MWIFLSDDETGFSLGPYDWDDEEGLYYGVRFLEEQGAKNIKAKVNLNGNY